MRMKNNHLEHPQDSIFTRGRKGLHNILNFLEEKKEIDKNCLEEACEGQEEGGFTRLDVDFLLQNFLANILEELNKQYKKKKIVISNQDGRVAGYNPNTLVTTLIEGGDVTLLREWDNSNIEITVRQQDGGHKINIDQKGGVVPEIHTDETTFNNTIDIII